jgi:dynein heavy chain
LANLKSALVVSNAKMKAELAALEGRILGLLSAASGNILDDEELINTLSQAKVRQLDSTASAYAGCCGCLPTGGCCYQRHVQAS